METGIAQNLKKVKFRKGVENVVFFWDIYLELKTFVLFLLRVRMNQHWEDHYPGS